MKERFISAFVVAVLGALIILTPQYLAPVCEKTITAASGMAVPMKCFWTARAVSALGFIIFFAGVALLFARNACVRAGIALMIIPVSIVTGLVPLTIIGVCANEMMPCHLKTLPAIGVLSILSGAFALGILIASALKLKDARGKERLR